jgi:hypothetical protein
MKKLQLLKHPKMNDVAMQILAKENLGTDRQELWVMWWNIVNRRKPWCMNIRQTLVVQNSFVDELVPYEQAVS